MDQNLNRYLNSLIEKVYPVYLSNEQKQTIGKDGLPSDGFDEVINCKNISELKELINYEKVREKVLKNFYEIMTN